MKKSFVAIALLLTAVLIGAACKSKTETTGMPAGQVIKTAKVNELTVTLLGNADHLKQGEQELTVAFKDALGKSVDVGAVSLNFHMPKMGSMAEMNDSVTFTTTDTPGVYRGKVNIEVGGEWQGQLAYEGPAGKGKTTFTVTAR
jgi:YtkA-like